MKKSYITTVCFMFFASAFSQTNDSVFIRQIADEILVNGKAYDDLRVLTKQVGGRLAGSPQMVKAEQWGLKTLESLHPDRAFLQQCMVPHWVRGGKDEAYAFSTKTPSQKVAKKSSKPLDVIALGNSNGSGAKGVTGDVI